MNGRTMNKLCPCVRLAQQSDLDVIVSIHTASFPEFFLTALGPAFLRWYYQLVLDFEEGLLLVLEQDGVVGGFAAGCCEPAAFYKFMSLNRWKAVLPVALSVGRQPRLITRFLNSYRRVRSLQRSTRLEHHGCCELSSIAVAPEHARRGYGTQLVRAFISHGRKRGAFAIYLYTDAMNNESVNKFYTGLGFRVTRTYDAGGGRLMCEYVHQLTENSAEADISWKAMQAP